MISLRVFIAALALVVKLDNVGAVHTWTSPVIFHYQLYPPYDKIFVNIILQNVPSEAGRYLLYYQTDNCDRSTTGQHSAAGCNVSCPFFMIWRGYLQSIHSYYACGCTAVAARNNRIPTNRTITIIQNLDKSSVRIYIELRSRNEFCATKLIMDGLRDTNANESQFRTACLNKYRNECAIIADFGNQCEGQTPAKIYCSQQQRVTCEVVDEQLPEDTVHQWYQTYRDGSPIGTIPPVKGNKTEFKMTFHKFDSNTYVSSVMHSTHWAKNLPTEELKVPLPTKRFKNYIVEFRKKYTAKEPVSFTCSNNAHTQIGWIEPTGNRITTYNKTTFYLRLTKGNKNRILCCLNYRIYTVGIKTIVERTVTNITVLLYEEPVNQDNKVNTSNLPLSTSSRAPVAQQNTAAVTPDTYKTVYYIAIAAVAGSILLASLIYVVIKKCWRKSSDPEQTLQLETYASTNMVLYAELDIRPGTGPPPASTEEATYAEIIGVLQPENGHVKK